MRVRRLDRRNATYLAVPGRNGAAGSKAAIRGVRVIPLRSPDAHRASPAIARGAGRFLPREQRDRHVASRRGKNRQGTRLRICLVRDAVRCGRDGIREELKLAEGTQAPDAGSQIELTSVVVLRYLPTFDEREPDSTTPSISTASGS
jgi:hypothetical protein